MTLKKQLGLLLFQSLECFQSIGNAFFRKKKEKTKAKEAKICQKSALCQKGNCSLTNWPNKISLFKKSVSQSIKIKLFSKSACPKNCLAAGALIPDSRSPLHTLENRNASVCSSY